MKNKIMTALAICILFASCSKENDTVSESETGTGIGTSITIDSTAISKGTPEGGMQTATNPDDLVEGAVFSNDVKISFGSTVSVVNPLASSGVTVTLSGSDVTISSTVGEVQYTISGTSANGSLKIFSEKKFRLNLNGTSITNDDGPAINIQSSKRAYIVINDNTSNTLIDGSTYTSSTEDQKGTLFSEGQLIFSGNGILNIKGNYKHAIASDDYVRVRSGVININQATTDGIHTNDAFIADGGTLSINASSDGIEVEEGFVVINNGTFTLNTGDDGIAASYEEADAAITPYVTINNGTISVKSTAGEGIESKSVLTINSGNIITQTSDDGLNAGTAIYINGGNIYAYSTGNDAIDSNGTFSITGGKIVAIGARSPEASIDCDARTLKITGGVLIGIAGSTSGPSASASSVNSLVMGSGSANQLIHIEAADGTEALTFLAPITYSTLIFSSAKLKTGTTYNVYTGGSVANGNTFYGLYMSGIYSTGTKSTSFTVNNRVTQIGGSISRG